MSKLVFIHVPIRNMYFLSGMEGFKKSEGRSTRGAISLQNWLRPPPQNWMRPYDSCSSAPTALMKELSTANLLSIHVLILRIFVFGGATRIVGAGSCQSQIWLCTVVLLANPLPGASGLEKLTIILMSPTKILRAGNPYQVDVTQVPGTSARCQGSLSGSTSRKDTWLFNFSLWDICSYRSCQG